MALTLSPAIEYAFTTNTALIADAVAYAFPDLTVYVAQTSSRTFRSVWLEVNVADVITATGGTITEWRVECQIDAVAYSTTTELGDISTTIENASFRLWSDNLATYFNTNFTGASHTVRCRIYVDQSTGTTLGVINANAKLVLQYEYDDAATTRTNTVRIPLDSPVGNLTTVLTEIGTNQIPNLSTFLPEASKVYRDIFFEMQFNRGQNSTTDFTLALALDAEAEAASGLYENALATSPYERYIWKRTDMDTTATHAFKARTVGVAAVNTLSVVLVVTYEYDEATTTSCMVSLAMPHDITSPLGGTAIADATRHIKEFKIVGMNITLAQSGFSLGLASGGDIAGLNLRAGSQAYRAYTHVVTAVPAGGSMLQQRIDSGGAQGAGMTLASGDNSITIDAYRTDTTDLGSIASGMIYVNYTVDKPAGGSHTLPKSTRWWMRRLGAQARLHQVTAFEPSIPETDYYVTDLGFEFVYMQLSAVNYVKLRAHLYTGEGFGAGYRTVESDILIGEAELGVVPLYAGAKEQFDSYPSDPDTNLMAIELARDYEFYSNSAYMGLSMWLTHYTRTFTFADSVTNYTGDGSGITVDIYSSVAKQLVGTVTTAVGGGYTFTWYDNVTNLFGVARQSATLMGRSDDGVAS